MPAAGERLKANYANQSDRLHFLNCAVSNRSGNLDMYEVGDEELEQSQFPFWVRQIASASEAQVKKHFPGTKIQSELSPLQGYRT